MKLLFDQNISFRIIKKIAAIYPDARHVDGVGLKGAEDMQIWQYAKNNNFEIVTFDSDFVDIANLKGHPPKIIWLRIGNTTTSGIANVLTEKYNQIQDFLSNPDFDHLAFLEIE